MGPLASQMAMHILIMNFAAPLAAMFTGRISRRQPTTGLLVAVTTLQMCVLWIWHTPSLLNEALSWHWLHVLMLGTFAVSSFLFWWTIVRFRGSHRWKPIVALLVTSKIYCLLAVLFVFSTRTLYALTVGLHGGHRTPAFESTVADQQLAGLIMLAACPVTYVVAAIVIAAQWVFAMVEEAGNTTSAQAVTGESAWT